MRTSRARDTRVAVAAAAAALSFTLGAGLARADAAAPTTAELAARVADLEAYITNTTPKAMTTSPGPGHNAWMMTSSALVLFMTLPGLGAVLRRPGAAQEHPVRHGAVPGLAGLVTMLWWAVGYSLAFSTAARRSSAGSRFKPSCTA